MNPQCDSPKCTRDATKTLIIDDEPVNYCDDCHQVVVDQMEDDE